MGLPSSCNDDDALGEASKVQMYTQIIDGVVSFLVSGTLGVMSDRFGRRVLLIITSFGQTVNALGALMTSTYGYPWFRENWRMWTYGMAFVNAATGGSLIAVLSFFACIADITKKRPELRSWLFVLVECVMNGSGIIAVLIGGAVLHKSTHLALLTPFIFAACAFLFALVVPETLPPEARTTSINFKRANTIAALLFALPIRPTRRSLEKDHLATMALLRERLEKKRAEEQTTALLTHESGLDEHVKSRASASVIACTKQVVKALEAVEKDDDLDDFPEAVQPIMANADTQLRLDAPDSPLVFPERLARQISLDTGLPAEVVGTNVTAPVLVLDADVQPHDDQNSTESRRIVSSPAQSISEPLLGDEGKIEASDAAPGAAANAGSNEPSLEELLELPPPRNLLSVLSISLLASCIAIIPIRSITILYVKRRFDMSDPTISYLLSVDSGMRVLGPPLFLPFIKWVFPKGRVGEIKIMQFLFFLDAIFLGLFGVLHKPWWCFLMMIFVGATLITPVGYVRSIMSTEVGPALQARVLSSIAAVQGVTVIGGSILFNTMFRATKKTMPEAVYYVMSALFIIAAAAPFLRAEDDRVINNRAFASTISKSEIKEIKNEVLPESRGEPEVQGEDEPPAKEGAINA